MGISATCYNKKTPLSEKLFGVFFVLLCDYLFKATFNEEDTLNAAVLDAGILISLPDCGLRPLRAGRSLTKNVPS